MLGCRWQKDNRWSFCLLVLFLFNVWKLAPVLWSYYYTYFFLASFLQASHCVHFIHTCMLCRYVKRLSCGVRKKLVCLISMCMTTPRHIPHLMDLARNLIVIMIIIIALKGAIGLQHLRSSGQATIVWKSCARPNHMPHINRLSRATCGMPHGTKGQLSY